MLRLFVAIDLPDAHRDRIRKICTGLPNARWAKPEQIHLTLRFIGETDEELFRKISRNLAEVRTEALDLKLKGVGQFPTHSSPRVLWVGVEDNSGLVKLRNEIEKALIESGLEPEGRKFAPHLTIARFKKEKAPRKIFREFMEENRLFELPVFQVGEFILYSSRLTPGGAIHRPEASYPVPRP